MKISELLHHILRVSAAASCFAAVAPCAPAYALGSLWTAGGQLEISDEQIILVDHPDATVSVVVQLQVDGAAGELTWVVPVPREPKVRVSSSAVFQRLAAISAPQHWVQVSDPCTLESADASVAAAVSDESPARVKLVDRGAISFSEYASFAAPSADPAAISAALAERGFAFSEAAALPLADYMREGMMLLALKLQKPSGTTIIRPIVLTYESRALSLPLRASASVTKRDLPLQLWVFGSSQAAPAGYQSLVVNDALFDWQSATKFAENTLPSNGAGAFGPIIAPLSNYAAVVTLAANEAEGGRGFLTESAAPTSQVRDVVWSEMSTFDAERVASQEGVDAVSSAVFAFGNWDGLRASVEAATQLPAAVSLDMFLDAPASYRGLVEVDSARFLELLERDVLAPVRETGALLQQAPYMTRLFTTLSAAELTLDPGFVFNFDLALQSNVHIAKQFLQCRPGDDPASAAWRMELPQGGVVVGSGAQAWPHALDAMPANLKLVELGDAGSGRVVVDNSAAIGRALFEAAGVDGTGAAVLELPQNGATIGGPQRVTPARATAPAEPSGCSASAARSGSSGWWMAALSVGLWRRARRSRKRPSRRAAKTLAAISLLLLAASSGACSEAAPAQAAAIGGALTAEQLRDPETCKECHAGHYREWSGSMHAFASRDPVFRAMNERGQRETNGELGDFCLKCHAPMAVRDGLSHDGLNLDALPHEDRGVTCYFCHSVVGIEGTHNGQLRIAADATFRGPIDDPLATPAHKAEPAKHFDENEPDSSAMCGACHDIVMPKGVEIERTFKEFQAGLFSKTTNGNPTPFAGCLGCHMQGKKGAAADVPGAPERIVHEHFWPGIDVALGDFPHRDAMRSAIEDCQLGSASISYFSLEVTPPNLFTFQIETNAGHNQPSGASQDRRMWLEFLAYDAEGNLMPEASSGDIADGQIEEDFERDPQLVLFGDRIFDEHGKRVHMFWDAAKSEKYPKGYESLSLPVASTTYVEGKHVIVKQLRAAGPDGNLPARISARLRIRPIGIDVLRDLVDSGDLERAIMDEMPTLSFAAKIEWTRHMGTLAPVYATVQNDCTTYRCLLDPQTCK
jgi:hypothetical protein